MDLTGKIHQTTKICMIFLIFLLGLSIVCAFSFETNENTHLLQPDKAIQLSKDNILEFQPKININTLDPDRFGAFKFVTDLEAKSLIIYPSNKIEVGKKVIIKGTIKNNANLPLIAEYAFYGIEEKQIFSLSPFQSGKRVLLKISTVNLQPNQEETVEFVFTPVKAGKGEITLVVDPHNEIAETSEENNQKSISIEIKGISPRPRPQGSQDIDEDGIVNINDNCPNVSNPDQLDTDTDRIGDACDTDDDNDTILDTNDNCQLTANLDQLDTDTDNMGNICDSDDDNDTILDGADNCPLAVNLDQADTDADNIGNVCDAVDNSADNTPEDNQQNTEEDAQDKIDDSNTACYEDAEDAIRNAKLALYNSLQPFDINDVEDAEDDLSSAKKLIKDAKNFNNDGKYDNAVDKAERAETRCSDIVDNLYVRTTGSSQQDIYNQQMLDMLSKQSESKKQSTDSQQDKEQKEQVVLLHNQQANANTQGETSEESDISIPLLIAAVAIASLMVAVGFGIVAYTFFHKKDEEETLVKVYN